MFRAGLYAGVSTNDQQTVPLQIRALREYAVRRDWTIALRLKEVGSDALQRQQGEKLLDAARRREMDGALVRRWDRWGRSVADLLATLQELEHLGGGFVSPPRSGNYIAPASSELRSLANSASGALQYAEFSPIPPRNGSADLPLRRLTERTPSTASEPTHAN